MKFLRMKARPLRLGILLGVVLATLSGCRQIEHHVAPQYVYVAAEHTFLRNRVAPVANFVTEVTNGERLRVLQHQTRFYQVKAPNGKVGWIEELYVVDQAEMDKFDALRKEYAQTPAVAKAILEETSYLHDGPSVEDPHYYLLKAKDKLDMLMRASVPRRESTLAMLRRKQAIKDGKTPSPIPMEDYWLVRDAKGRTGWVRGSALVPDVPNSVLVLAPSERMIGAYLFRKVMDPKSDAPDHMMGEYVAVFAPYRAGLPYDFDEIRVFTYDVPRHQYETAYSVHHIEGFFPVKVGQEKFGQETDPVFSFEISKNPNIALDPDTGRLKPGPLVTVKYRMEGVIARQIEGPAVLSARPVVRNRGSARHFRGHRKLRHKH
jgi:SH3-like domain-containing protein